MYQIHLWSQLCYHHLMEADIFLKRTAKTHGENALQKRAAKTDVQMSLIFVPDSSVC
jgi:hypothetical protein